jgi:hypothetical protein
MRSGGVTPSWAYRCLVDEGFETLDLRPSLFIIPTPNVDSNHSQFAIWRAPRVRTSPLQLQ